MKNTKRILSGILVLVMVMALLPFGAFAEEAADVTINIAAMTNGTVTADKDSYKVGDTVTLTVTPNSGYVQKLYINGESLMLDYTTGQYSFVATEEVYDITGSFEPEEKWFWTADWNLINQGHGIAHISAHPEGTQRSGDLVPAKGLYNSVSVLFKDVSHGAQKEYAVVLKMHLVGGKKVEVRLIDRDDNGKYCLQAMGDSFSSWNTLYWLTEEENQAVVNGDGVWYNLHRYGTIVYLHINGKEVTKIDMSAQGITAETEIDQLKIQTYNFGYAADVPYEFKMAAPNVEVKLPALENGTITADKDSYCLGDTVTLTVTPNENYAQKLYIDGQPMMLDYATGQYSFVATKRSYEITGSFEPTIGWFWTGDWDLANQAHGIIHAPANTDHDQRTGDLVPKADACDGVSVLFKDVTGGAQKEFAMVLKMHLAGGLKAEVRLIDRDDNGKYCLQAMGDSFSSWSTLYWLTDAENEAVVSGDGVWYSMTREGAKLYLHINGHIVKEIDMSAKGIAAETVLNQVKVQVYNFRNAMDIPYVFRMAESAAVEVNIPTMENGTITANKESFKLGDVVNLKIAPNAGYTQKLYINGEPLMLDWKKTTYSFVATEPVYEITGSFEAVPTVTPGDGNRWDANNYGHGILNAYYPANNDSWWVDISGEYYSFAVIAKNALPVEDSMDGVNGSVGFATILRVKMDNGKSYTFRVYNDKGTYAYQECQISGAVTGWNKWTNIHHLADRINGEGVEFKVVRSAINKLSLYVDGVLMQTYTMEGVTAANKMVSVGVQHNGNKGEYVAIPFALKDEDRPAAIVNIAEMTGGTVTTDQASYKVGDTVTLTITPNSGYFQKLYVNGEPIILGWKTFTYSFVATEPVMEITGSFETGANLTPGDWSRWDDHNQAHGQFTAYYPNANDSWWMIVNGDYQAMTVVAKNYWAIADTLDNFMVNLKVTMDNGHSYNFRIFTDKGGYTAYNRAGIKNESDASADWGSWKNLSAFDSKITTEGVAFKVERTAANVLTLSVDGQVVDTYTMKGITADNKIASIAVQHQGNKGTVVQVPYEMTKRVFDYEVCGAAGTVGGYTDFAQAQANCGEGQYIKLNKDVTVNATLTKDLYIDLNGFSLNGTITANGFKVYGMNTTTDGYENATGKINCGVAPEAYAQITLNGELYRYMAVQNADGSYSFYRFYVGITTKTLAPAVTGIGFKAEFYGSEAVKGNIASFGYSLQLGNNKAVIRTVDAEGFVTGITGKELTLRINNWDLVNHGATQLNATAVMILKDGTVIEGAQHTMTMQELVEYINDNLGVFSANQILAVQDMLAGYSLDWNISNIVNYIAPTAALYYVNEKKAVVADPFV